MPRYTPQPINNQQDLLKAIEQLKEQVASQERIGQKG